MINLFSYVLVFFITVLSILFLKPLAFRYQLLDIPDSRKIHNGSVPLIGGIAMFIGLLCGLAINRFLISNTFIFFVLSSFILLILGVIDDFRDVSPFKRFFFQIISSLIIIYAGGVLIEDLGSLISNQILTLGIFAVFFSVFSIIGVLNSLNFSDGIDGLSASLSLVTFCSIAFFVYLARDFVVLNFVICFIVSILAFLLFNVGLGKHSKYRVFMGDSGSTFLGFGIAFSLILFSQSDYLFFSPVVALWIYAIPLLDTASIMIRRIVNGKSPFSADREHLHHYLIVRGWSDRQALGIIVLFSSILAIIGIIFEISNMQESYMFLVFMIIAIIYYFLLSYAWKRLN